MSEKIFYAKIGYLQSLTRMSCLLDLLFQMFRKPRIPTPTAPPRRGVPLPQVEREQGPQVERERGPQCPICLESIGRKSRATTLVCRNRPCKTYYHKSCFLDWLAHCNSTEPKCVICTLPKVGAYRKKRKPTQNRIIYVRPRR